MRIKVGPAYFDVLFQPMDVNFASIQEQHGRISVDSEMPMCYQRMNLIHEALHACWRVAWDTTLSARTTQELSEEQVVSFLTPFITQLLQDNPEFVKFITGKENA